jgi:hypothetical protein
MAPKIGYNHGVIHRIFLSLFLLLGTLFTSTHVASAQTIRNLDVVIRAQKDGTLDVTENIAIDFGKTPFHGIFRWFPLEKSPGSKEQIKIRLLHARQNRKPTPFEITTKDNKWNIHLGGSEAVVSGLQKYSLRYAVRGAIFRNGEKPFVAWNSLGKWPYRIQRATVRFYPPSGINARHLPAEGFYGAENSSRPAALMRWRRSLLWYTHNLPPQNDLTFYVTLPRNSMSVN